MPSRNEEERYAIKNGIVPRKGFRFIDPDYSTLEVRISNCYHHDPNMTKYLWDPGNDMHLDTCMDCFLLDPDEVDKASRDCTKNDVVFPQFYGDYYVNCATNLWNDIHKYHLKTKSGVPMMEHLKKHGITSYSKFEDHMAEVEEIFWQERFPVYNQWKKDTWQLYLEQGYLESFFGFRFGGGMDRNNALNYQIQSTAFHCLLWAYIHINKQIKEDRLMARLLGETHDSLLQETPESEFNYCIEILKKNMVDDLLDNFSWINCPIEIEIETTEVDQSWYHKKLFEVYRKEPNFKLAA